MPTARGRLNVSAKHRLRVRRTEHATKKRKSPNNLFKYLISVLLFSLFILCSWNLYNSWKNSQWISGARITIVVGTTDPKIYSYNPQAEKLSVISVPANIQISSSRGMGDWLAGSLWKLGEQEKLGGKLLAESLQKTLGLPIDAWVEEKGEALFVNRKLGFASAFLEAATSSGIKTNLTFFDRLQLLMQVGSVSYGGRRDLDLATLGVIKKQKLTDGEDGYIVIPEKGKVAFEGLKDDLIFAESKKVKVFNTSDKSGLAIDVTRVVTTLGLRVIGTGAGEKVVNCEVRGDGHNLKSISARRLAAVLGCELRGDDSGGPEDLELWLGDEFAEKF